MSYLRAWGSIVKKGNKTLDNGGKIAIILLRMNNAKQDLIKIEYYGKSFADADACNMGDTVKVMFSLQESSSEKYGFTTVNGFVCEKLETNSPPITDNEFFLIAEILDAPRIRKAGTDAKPIELVEVRAQGSGKYDRPFRLSFFGGSRAYAKAAQVGKAYRLTFKIQSKKSADGSRYFNSFYGQQIHEFNGEFVPAPDRARPTDANAEKKEVIKNESESNSNDLPF